MSFSYGFFNAQNLDRVYTAEDFTAYLSSLICNGILDTYRQCFAPTIKNLSVTFGTGKAWIDGHYFISDTLHTIDLSSYVDESLNRYVAIGIYCDRSTRTVWDSYSGRYSSHQSNHSRLYQQQCDDLSDFSSCKTACRNDKYSGFRPDRLPCR